MPHNSVVPREIDSFDLQRRLAALREMAGKLDSSAGHQVDAAGMINLHIHSFYSYNCRGYSPAHIALECRQNRLYAAGLCDFDVLDGLEEFYAAGQMLGLRVVVHLETRVYLKECVRVEVNSPGEPGVIYILAAGFGCLPEPNSTARDILSAFRRQANLRNRALVDRINARLPEIALAYDADVLPHSPGGCPTERHIVRAYRLKAEKSFPAGGVNDFWAKLFSKPRAEMDRLLADQAALEEKIRSLLVKSGGVGYVLPTAETFPSADDFISWALSCNAIPMVAWLDGTTRGEENAAEILECLKAKGAAALNIIPDRNHNIKDPADRRRKLQKLAEIIAAARALAFPVNIGTELNRNGQPAFDDLESGALAPYRPDFLRGASIMIGQGILARYAGFSYCAPAALGEFGPDTESKNNFFESVGQLPPLNCAQAGKLAEMGFAKAFQYLRDSAAKRKWLTTP